MHCALQRTNSDIQKNSDTRRYSLSKKEQKSFRTSLDDCEVPYVTGRNSDRRCPILSVLFREPDGHWRTVALPPLCPDNINHLVSGTLVNMDALHLVYPPPINPFKVNRQKVQKWPPLDFTYSVKSFTGRRFTGSAVHHQSRNKTLANKATKWNELSRKSFHNGCSDSSSTIPNGSNSINSSTMSNKKINSIAKRSSRKKSRKKGKQSTKVSNEPEVLSEEYANGSSASEPCGNNDGDGQVSSSTATEISLPDSGPKNSETPNTCTSSSDEVSCYSDMYTRGYSDMHDSFVLDSMSIGSNSGDSINAGHDEKHAEKEIFKIDISKPPGLSSGKGRFSCQRFLNDVVDNYDHTEEARHGIQGCRSNDMQLVVPNKRSKQNKVAPRTANVSKFGSNGNLHIRIGKENNHSVWQKVQRNDSSDCTGELKKASSVYSRLDLPLREAPLLKRTSNVADVNAFSKSEDKKQQKDKVSKKLKRKTGPPLKQEYNFYSRKGSHASIAGLDGCAKARMDQNDILDISSQLKDKKSLSLVSRSCSPPSCPRGGYQSSKVECMTSESVHNMKLCQNEMDHFESVCVGNKNSSVQRKWDSLSESNLLQVQSPVYLPHLLCNATSQEVQKEVSLAESSRQNSSSSGSLKHKWMPIGSKNPGLTSSTRSGSSSLEHSDEAASKRWALKDPAKGNVVSNTQNLVSKVAVGCTGQNSEDVTCSSDAIDGRLSKSSTIEDLANNKHDVANCINDSAVSKDLNVFEAESNRILEAVNNACRAQLASEAVQMATGRPIAEFERLLYYSSPVIHQSPNSISCHTCCSRNQVDQVGGVSLCRHETPHTTLGCLWQWYEKYGSYGLEIRAEEFGNSKRLGADHFAFRAYFVPYLSGIQLFRNGRSTDSVDINNRLHSSQELSTCRISKTPKKSSSIEQSSASAKDVSAQLADTTGSSDLELLFEYFESEQPQERRPLYDKIKELVRGDGLSHSKVYGDPTKLDSINLNDLHPRSWYSVAWYPIYRIPDGNFRAAFLTYHSLGHLVHRHAKFESRNVDSCIVSPVVGLRSYNAQDECWFQLRPSTLRQTTVTPGLNPCGVLEERLRTLEETASLMARAVVNKGSMTSVNRHPDYEFFLSRRRW
ncbi:hypothetical protein PRUPE_5G240600 [Prunus persica]|uniref:Uncharacterized protein n=1 Tax=Prunus persica TaxID=3760 RepID=A0A251PD15_PRUPE|nr:hypothetical protein PRUPE_5G240600 [Prunus persica]ONI09482.1 hypothetical protein PRUPE_5G240600 [Prunus persica]